MAFGILAFGIRHLAFGIDIDMEFGRQCHAPPLGVKQLPIVSSIPLRLHSQARVQQNPELRFPQREKQKQSHGWDARPYQVVVVSFVLTWSGVARLGLASLHLTASESRVVCRLHTQISSVSFHTPFLVSTMMLQLNSPFAKGSSSRADLALQLKDSVDECNRLRQALHTLNDSSLNFKNNAEKALELAKHEIDSLKSQLASAKASKEAQNKLRAQIVRLQRGAKADSETHLSKVEVLEETVALLRDEAEQAQETIHHQRVKFQGALRDKNQQLLEAHDGIRRLKQKVAHLEHENKSLSTFS